MKYISILGSTGSIGTQTLEVVRENTDLKVIALTADKNIELLEKQIREFHPVLVSVSEDVLAKELRSRIKDVNTKVLSGMDGLIACATEKSVKLVVTAVVGMIGIRPTIEAIKAGKDIALANKETLVTAGHIIMPLIKEHNVRLLPVDSEHSAIFQALNGETMNRISKIILTASGGPFRGKKKKDLEAVTVEDALRHPNWSMGRKITIDSSTMVNKGLEVIEAKWLFHVDLDRIQVVIQPQSVIHSAVEFEDGGIVAQMGTPDMRLPIQYALFYPERRNLKGERLNLFQLGKLTFEEPDYETFRGLRLAFDASREGGSFPTVYNAANECAVAKFLNREINYLEITGLIDAAMKNHKKINHPTIQEILNIEKETYDFIRLITT
ncbi:1-deoxy-D-xylulose 5-phosphate reductoisomerase [Anaerocolumna cellulosilytica]|uniref:1-deoxy-D-xylulose 5-phosphate reductoisomerase n=1 Tax=Anaerocolumna cellulosilytica TaxID=433286 RepID=A0A6S6R264_9FIRM|nr:1-deoxy-D-xylulose-5-phosphate reductoisomerase [Anaerocolumna cellulosilytica]MBB5197413.1 1-deoxy-D-xylulose-5-phosphate reductoisomerase [Anaerocolumna cellulosilytica]BCJ95429.1 1-deoxy-D-xylulose 5-phosphate reductoisomerase [Anaerocolumna cellulosilytica]